MIDGHEVQARFVRNSLDIHLPTVYSHFFPGRRIPSLISIVHTERGPIALKMEANIHKKVKFTKMFGRIVLEKNLLLMDLSEKYEGLLPYDRKTYLSFVEI